MTNKRPISSRIVDELVRTIGAIDGVGTVSRWDTFGSGGGDFDVVVSAHEIIPSEGGQGNRSITTVTMTVSAIVTIITDPTSSLTTDEIAHRWMGKIHDAVLADSGIGETGTGEQLANDVRFSGFYPIEFQEEGSDISGIQAVVMFEVEFDTYRNDAHAGPGVNTKTEA